MFKRNLIPEKLKPLWFPKHVFCISKNNSSTTHLVLAKNFVQTHKKITAFLENHPGPCLVTITRPSKMEDYFAERPGNVNPQIE
jgi:hypothetical protein